MRFVLGCIWTIGGFVEYVRSLRENAGAKSKRIRTCLHPKKPEPEMVEPAPRFRVISNE